MLRGFRLRGEYPQPKFAQRCSPHPGKSRVRSTVGVALIVIPQEPVAEFPHHSLLDSGLISVDQCRLVVNPFFLNEGELCL